VQIPGNGLSIIGPISFDLGKISSSALSGNYSVNVLASSAQIGSTEFNILPALLSIGQLPTRVTAGSNLAVEVTNAGGGATNFNLSVVIASASGVVFSQSIPGTIATGQLITETYNLPSGILRGTYRLSVTALDTVSGKQVGTVQTLQVTGIQATINASSSQHVLNEGVAPVISGTIQNSGSVALAGGSLDVSVVNVGQSALLSGVVEDASGQPVRGARVVLDEGQAATYSDAGGNFSFGYQTAGQHIISVTKLGYQAVTKSIDFNGSAVDITIDTEAPGGATGIVVDQNGVPITGASVQLTSVDNAENIPYHFSYFTQYDGSFNITNLVPGTYQLSVTGPGWANYSTNISVISGEDTNIGKIELSPQSGVSGSVAGAIIDANSNLPISGATVQEILLNSDGSFSQVNGESALTDQKGTFSLSVPLGGREGNSAEVSSGSVDNLRTITLHPNGSSNIEYPNSLSNPTPVTSGIAVEASASANGSNYFGLIVQYESIISINIANTTTPGWVPQISIFSQTNTGLSQVFSGTGLSVSTSALSPGNYVIEVSNNQSLQNENYRLTVSQTWIPQQNNTTYSSAEVVSLDGSVEGYLNPSVQSYYYKINVPSSGLLTVSVDQSNFSTNGYGEIELENSSGGQVTSNSNYWANTSQKGELSVRADIGAGTYYVRVEDAFSNELTPFILSDMFSPSSSTILGSTCTSNAIPVVIGTKDVRQLYLYNVQLSTGGCSSGQCAAYFSFSLVVPAQVYFQIVCGPTDAQISILDGSGNVLVPPSSSIAGDLLNAGTYYVGLNYSTSDALASRVVSLSLGRIDMAQSLYEDSSNAIFANSSNAAANISLGQNVLGYISDIQSQTYYTFTALAPGELSLTFSEVFGSISPTVSVESNGMTVSSGTFSLQNSPLNLSWFQSENSTYTVIVNGSSGQQSGVYSIAVNETPVVATNGVQGNVSSMLAGETYYDYLVSKNQVNTYQITIPANSVVAVSAAGVGASMSGLSVEVINSSTQAVVEEASRS